MSDSLRPHGLWTIAQQAPQSFTISLSLLRFMSIELVILSSHFILCFPLVLLPSIFPSIRVFSSELALCITWLRASTWASVLPRNIQGWFSLRLSGLISLREFIELSRVFFSTTIQNISSLALSLLYGPTLTSVHDYWKNHIFDYMDLFQQSDVSAF